MIQENKKSKILKNPDSEVIKSFLKDSENYEEKEKEIISSNS